jgi:hypothetical protein
VSELTEKDFQLLRGTLRRWRNYALAGAPITPSVGVIDKLSAALDEVGQWRQAEIERVQGKVYGHSAVEDIRDLVERQQAVELLITDLAEGDMYSTSDPSEAVSDWKTVDDAMTRRELLDVAKSFNITLPRNPTKAQILESIRAYAGLTPEKTDGGAE